MEANIRINWLSIYINQKNESIDNFVVAYLFINFLKTRGLMTAENSEDKKLFELIPTKLFTSVSSFPIPPHDLRNPSVWHWSKAFL